MREELRKKLKIIPPLPGVYRYYNLAGEIIYVGKAKNLHRRVNSYFNRSHDDSIKTAALVRHIVDVQYTVVESEQEALLLENSLIKEYQPHYNILLKDGKSYPWICITIGELYPRVFITRNRLALTASQRPGSALFFGPYSSPSLARVLMELLQDLYPLRQCQHTITADVVQRCKIRPCLLAQLHRCASCCTGKVSREEYMEWIEEVRHILSGRTRIVMDHLRAQMEALSEEWRFEEAEELRKKYVLLERYSGRSVVVSARLHNLDVYSLVKEGELSAVNYLHVREGSITTTYTLECQLSADDSESEMLGYAIGHIRELFPQQSEESSEIILSHALQPEEEETLSADERTQRAITTQVQRLYGKLLSVRPQRGDKRKLLSLSEKNARQYLQDQQKLRAKDEASARLERLKVMQHDLGLSQLPRHIECFDNSNIQGTVPVASCVVFRDGVPSKADYRHFNIKTVVGADDFASMKEILTRRYSRMLTEAKDDLPQLIIVDGGKGQLSSAVEALQSLGLDGQITVVGIAKRLEEIYYPNNSRPLMLPRDGSTMLLIKHIDDEAHHFGITFHRNKRSTAAVHSALDDIQGVGKTTRTALIKQFKSLKRVRECSLQELASVIGTHRASLVYTHFHSDNEANADE